PEPSRTVAEDTPPIQPKPDTTALEAARTALRRDPPRAAELAEGILKDGASGPVEAGALAILADAERRRGRLREAASTYAKVRDHAEGAPYAEEAMLQRALLLVRVHEDAEALLELDRLERAHPDGPTAPERASLAASLLLARGDPEAAAS